METLEEKVARVVKEMVGVVPYDPAGRRCLKRNGAIFWRVAARVFRYEALLDGKLFQVCFRF